MEDFKTLITKINATTNEDKGKEIEKKFYTHYKKLREQIWTDLIDQNKEKHYGRNFYLYKAQKLIDRIIFIRFCRENGALDSDVVSDALSYKFAKGKYYEILKDLFNVMNEGNPEIGIARFNGGLFAVDSDLDCLNISDDIISKIVILYDYNFGSDLDVNILGHIFEQSISDLEDLTSKSDERKRKKDGVFYTPSYITKYIVNEAIGGWLADKKLEITAQEGSKDWWQAYAEKLKAIKIVDPACGSGAFLVKVFDYLQAQWIEVHKQDIAIDYTYKDILKNNIYGVDLNPTSVGITKLSLWLKIAHYKEPLTTLDNNIKVGNSLIDNEDVAGYYYEHDGEFRSEVIPRDLLSREKLDKDREDGIKTSLAFKWKEQFSNVFATGGFDVVVGNPPYVKEENNKEIFEKFKNSEYYEGKMDLCQLFVCYGLNLLKNNAYLSFILPNNLTTNKGASKTRKKITQESLVIKYVDFNNNKIFESADIQTMIFVLKKEKIKNQKIHYYGFTESEGSNFAEKSINIQKDLNNIKYDYINMVVSEDNINTIHFMNDNIFNIIKKIEKNSDYKLKENDISNGIHTHHGEVDNKRLEILGKGFNIGDGIFSISNEEKRNLILSKKEEIEILKPEYTTTEIDRYYFNKDNKKWLIYTDSSFKNLDKISNYPNIKKHLDKFRKVITSDNAPYGLHRSRKEDFFIGEKIISLRKCTKQPRFSYSDIPSYVSATFNVIKPIDINMLYLLSLLNSKVIAFYLKHNGKMQGSNYQVDKGPLCKIPLISSAKNENQFIKKAQDMILLNKEFYELSNKFLELLKVDLGIAKITKKLESWYKLQDNEFFSELGKQNKNLSLKNKSEWQNHFEQEKTKALELQNKISTTDNEIDTMVYALYGLNDEEIKTIEDFYI